MGIRRQITEESLANVEYVARDSAKLRAPLAPLPEEHGREENEGFDGAAGLGSADAPQRRAGAEARRTKPGAAPHEDCGGEGAVPKDGRYKEPTLRNRVCKILNPKLSCPHPCTTRRSGATRAAPHPAYVPTLFWGWQTSAEVVARRSHGSFSGLKLICCGLGSSEGRMADLEAVAADAVAVGEAMALAVAGAGAVVLYVGQTSMGGWDGVSEESGGLRVAIRPSGVRRLRAVSCGQGHCVVLGHGGEVFAWGSNDHGQTGVGSESDEEPSPREVLGLSGKGVGQLACGAVHTVALCEGGAVLGAGSNRQGQLGLRGVGELRRAGALEWRLRAAVNGAGADAGAAGGEVVLQIVCGAFHTLALTGGGALWACGANSHGQLGLGMLADCRAPERVPLPPSAGRAAQACAGRRHSGILSERGGVRFPLELCVVPASITPEKHLLACGRAPGMKFADRGSRCCCAATTRSGSWARPARRSARNSCRALPSAAWR